MSRTNKDRPSSIRFPQYEVEDFAIFFSDKCYLRKISKDTLEPYLAERKLRGGKRSWYVPTPTSLAKQRRSEHKEWSPSIPSWWTRLKLTRPVRRASHMWESTAEQSLDDSHNFPQPKRLYYW